MRRALPNTAVSGEPHRWLMINPYSGQQAHAARIQRLAAERGYTVWRTETANEGAALAQQAATANTSVFAICGGDGTIHAAVNGLHRAGALSEVTLGVIPAGTGNGFAGALGIDGIKRGFDVIEAGTTRKVRIHQAGSRLFLNGCTVGLNTTTEVSGPPTQLKRVLGRFAYRLGGAVRAATADASQIEIRYTGHDESDSWSGRALCVLVGRPTQVVGQSPPTEERTDSLSVAIVKYRSLHRLAAGLFARRTLDQTVDAITTFTARSLDILATDGDPFVFCFDGELYAHSHLSLNAHSEWLSVRSPAM